jgi:predicted RND superfamily exporter protein
MPNRIHRWVAASASWLLILTAALTLVALAQLIDPWNGSLRLSIDPSLDTISTQSQADRDYADLVRLRFGNREPVMVVLQSDEIYSLENLVRLDRLSRALASLDGVESVSSLTATAIPRVDDGILSYSRVTPEALRDPETPGLLRSSNQGEAGGCCGRDRLFWPA